MRTLISKDGLHHIMPRATVVNVDAFFAPLNEAMERWHIVESPCVAAFVANVAHESSELNSLRENMNYSAERLLQVFPKYFTQDIAAAYAHQPNKIANRVYASRLGNGDEASGDGWAFRGGGLFQTTGRKNFGDTSVAICGDADTLLNNPELIVEPRYASESAGYYWDSRGLSELAARGAFEEIVRKIQGALLGLEHRLVYLNRAVDVV